LCPRAVYYGYQRENEPKSSSDSPANITPIEQTKKPSLPALNTQPKKIFISEHAIASIPSHLDLIAKSDSSSDTLLKQNASVLKNAHSHSPDDFGFYIDIDITLKNTPQPPPLVAEFIPSACRTDDADGGDHDQQVLLASGSTSSLPSLILPKESFSGLSCCFFCNWMFRPCLDKSLIQPQQESPSETISETFNALPKIIN